MQRDTADVYLLGAGFARAVAPSMPLLQDLGHHVLQELGPGGRVPAEVAAMMKTNFAHALSYLEQAKPWITEADNLRHRALFLEISNAMAQDLEERVSRAADTLCARTPPWLRQIIRHWHARRSTVLTLNYDTLIETVSSIVPLPGAVHLSARDLYPPLLTDADMRTGGRVVHRPIPTYRLLKLHGSTNWYYSGRALARGEPIYFVPPPPYPRSKSARRSSHVRRLNAVADKYPFLVPPIYDKSSLFTHETIRALWFEAGEALARARRVVCMGYSLPESDLTMGHFLRTTCADGARFEVINQSEDALPHFQELFRDTSVQVSQPVRGRDCIARAMAQEFAHVEGQPAKQRHESAMNGARTAAARKTARAAG